MQCRGCIWTIRTKIKFARTNYRRHPKTKFHQKPFSTFGVTACGHALHYMTLSSRINSVLNWHTSEILSPGLNKWALHYKVCFPVQNNALRDERWQGNVTKGRQVNTVTQDTFIPQNLSQRLSDSSSHDVNVEFHVRSSYQENQFIHRFQKRSTVYWSIYIYIPFI
jgi:hypothetical protein